MSRRFLRKIFPVLAMALLAPYPVAYAHDNSLDVEVKDAVRVEAAQGGESAWNVYGGAIGGVTAPVDLFYIDASECPADIGITLYLTNADELVHGYAYLNLGVGVHLLSDVTWEAVSINEMITLRNGQMSFTLPGYSKYKLTIDGGCFRCVASSGGSLSPQFYLTVD